MLPNVLRNLWLERQVRTKRHLKQGLLRLNAIESKFGFEDYVRSG
jgi:hypothetical protein